MTASKSLFYALGINIAVVRLFIINFLFFTFVP